MALSGRHLRVAVDTFVPWVTSLEDGIAITILNTIAQKLNFTYDFVVPADRESGRALPNGSYTGMIGMLDRKEVDVALGPFTVSYSRFQRVDFSTYIYYDHFGIFIPHPHQETDLAGFLRPFTAEVWLAFVFSLFMTLFMGSILRCVRSPDYLLYYGSIVRTIMNEANTRLPKSPTGRTLVGTWLLASFVLSVAYTGVLTSLLTVPIITHPVNSVDELLSYGKIPWALETGGVMYQGFAMSEDERAGKIFRKAHLLPDLWENRHILKEERMATFMGYLTMKQIIDDDYSRTGTCNFYIAKEILGSTVLSLGFPKGSDLIPMFNKWLSAMVEGGHVARLLYSLTSNASFCMNEKTHHQQHQKRRLVLTTQDFAGVFLLLVGGYIIGFLVLLAEIVYHRITVKRGVGQH